MPFPTDFLSLWRDISQAISERNINPSLFSRFYIGGIHHDTPLPSFTKIDRQSTVRSPLSHYYLGDSFPNVYLTAREADCMSLLLAGYSNPQVAEELHLSPRTVEFYIKNMRQKLGCHNKTHLIRTVRATHFSPSIVALHNHLKKDGASHVTI